MDAVRILYRQVEDLELKPNFLTFAILLQCHGRQEVLAVDAVKQVLKDISRAVSSCFVSCDFSICNSVLVFLLFVKNNWTAKVSLCLTYTKVFVAHFVV